MDEADHAQCVSELASKKVVFEQPKEATREGCRLSAPVSLSLVATQFGDVSLPAKPSMLCSFGLKFTDWVRDVAAPLTLAYTGQKLAEIETGPGFTCTARYDKPGALPSEHAKGDAIDVVSFVLADKRRVTVKEPDPLYATPLLSTTAALRLFHMTVRQARGLIPSIRNAHDNPTC